MVLFREDEKRMKAQEKQEKLARRTKLGFWVRRFIKIGMVLAVIFGISLALLAKLGGDHAALKKGIEDYITQATGLQAEIGEFDHMGFFPNLKLDAGQILLRKDGESKAVVTIRVAKFSAGFFDLMFSRQRIKSLNIENLYVAPGIFGAHELVIDRMVLEEKAVDDGAALIVAGHYGEQDIAVHMEMERDRGVFKLSDSSDFKINFGEFSAQGKTERVKWGGVKLQIDTLGLPDNTLSGEVVIKKRILKNHIKADLEFGGSRFQASLKTASKYLKGDINFPVLVLEDIAVLAGIYNFMASLPAKKSDGLIDLYGLGLNFDVAVEELRGGKGSLGNVNLNVVLKSQIATALLSGDFSGGELSGTFNLDAASLPAKLKMNSALKNWDYGQVQKAMFGRENVSGTANIHMAVEAEGKTYDDLIKALKGEAVLVAGKGEMTSGAFNIWGGGLVNALLPGLDDDSETTLNCMIADFKIEDGIARPEPLFVDTARVTVIGEGDVNIFENKINLKLEPKAKDPAFLDIASAINIKGPILKPSIGVDTFSLFEKLGGLALGVVNPAFLALSMTDLGVTEEHPCYEFIGKPKEEEPKK